MAKLNWNRQYLRQERIKRREETAVYTNGRRTNMPATKNQRKLLRALGYAKADDPFLLLTEASQIISAAERAKKQTQE